MDGRAEVIEELRALIAEQAAQLEQQAAQLKQQAARIAELELALAKAQKNSATSSKPPSSDLTNPPPKRKRPGCRKRPRRGAQPGHERHVRELLPPERVDDTRDYEIDEADVRRLHLVPTGAVDVIQHFELPQTPVQVTEYRLAVYCAPKGDMYIPDVPELDEPLFGPRLLATIGWLKSVGHLSYSTLEAWMEDVLQVPVSRGYLAKLCTGPIAASLAPAYAELTEAIPRQAQLGSDETSLKDNGKRHWIWCITAATFSVFHIAATRSRAVLEKLIGPEFSGYVNFDYFSANRSFAWTFWIKAQYCWAHLIRDIRFLQTHPDPQTQAWAEQLLERARRLFAAWHRRDTMSAQGLRRSMLTHRDRFLQVVRHPPAPTEAQTLAARFAIVPYTPAESSAPALYDLSQDYFRFMFTDGVEPTNNHCEQQIRHCVIDRRITQGTRGTAGQRYHERMWTAIATCRKQQRNFFSFLQASIKAHLDQQPAPSLLQA
jgi:transposase